MGNKDVVKEAKIKLPSKNGEPDWEYMKEYMVEIENKCIAKLKKFALTVGVNFQRSVFRILYLQEKLKYSIIWIN
jgi:hypothetical protein